MKIYIKFSVSVFICTLLLGCNITSDKNTNLVHPTAYFPFNGSTNNVLASDKKEMVKAAYKKGIAGKSIELLLSSLPLNVSQHTLGDSVNFSVQFWVKTKMDIDKRAIFLSTKRMNDNSLASQKQAGWVLGINHGNLFWNVGTGKRRLTYDRENLNRFPLNDGKWHLITMSYDANNQQICLYNDGENVAIYNLNDGDGFSFESEMPLLLGWINENSEPVSKILPAIKSGAEQLQVLVNEYNALGVAELEAEDLITLVAKPKLLLGKNADNLDLKKLQDSRSELMKNPYTIHQAPDFIEVAPISKLYSLANGIIVIDKKIAADYTQNEKLYHPGCNIDELKIWDKTLSSEQVMAEYSNFKKVNEAVKSEMKDKLVVADWNIWHGGKHWTLKEHGWDSRIRIAEMLKEEGADVVMMQETYSSGDFIAAELGYYFATTADWDYLNQGSNISVLSRYPIKEVKVPNEASFMNVAAKIELSKGQEIWVMSNWYGMSKFPVVFDFHKTRFENTGKVPVLFGGDFNAVPHNDGGKSPASEKLLNSGFTDAFRRKHPDVEKYPGYTHRGGVRIDQIYYKGKKLKNITTKVISSHPNGFPSDHYMIIADFELN